MSAGVRFVDTSNVPGVFDLVVGILGVIGFGLALAQLWRTTGALKAAERMYHSSQARFAANQAIQEITLLRTEVQKLTEISHQTDRKLAQGILDTCIALASRLASLMELANREIATPPGLDLNSLIAESYTARHHLGSPPAPTTSVFEQIGTTINNLEQALVALHQWSTTLQMTDASAVSSRKARRAAKKRSKTP